uniref:CCHC-type domain-containing protein n=1 Tax=Cannabis sativa TaxID=3483 RepID=A0A803PK87_CANSA
MADTTAADITSEHPAAPNLNSSAISNRPLNDDNSSPFFLSTGDHPRLVLVSTVLNGSNYQSWKRGITMVLVAKNKIAFIDGSLPRPEIGNTLLNSWLRCNNMVMSRLVNSEERQHSLGSTKTTPLSTASSSMPNHPPRAKKPRPSCSNCGKPGHIVDKCYFLHWFSPDGHLIPSDLSTQCQHLISLLSQQLSNNTPHVDLAVMAPAASNRIPKKICRKIDAMVRRFWWTGGLQKNHFFAATRWESLCQPKQRGGLGFRKFDKSFVLGKPFGRWKRSKPWIPWLGYEEFRKTMEEIRFKAPTLRTVSDLFLQSQGVWNQRYVCYLFGDSLGMQITSIEIVGDLGKDRLVWKRTPSGCFLAKEAYWADLEHRFGEAQKVWKLIWSSRIHLRAGLFLWRMCSDVLPTIDKLGRVDENWCLLCNCAAGSSLHIFFECSLTRSVWFGAPIPLRIEGLQGGNVLARIQDMCCNLSEEEASRLLVYGYVIWDTIWKFRNSRLFGGKCRDSLSLLVEVRKRFEEFYGITSLVATKVPQQAIQFVHRAPFNSKILVTDGSFKDGCCGLAAVGIERNTSAWNYVCRSSEGISALDVELKAIAMALHRLPDWKLAAGFSNILKLVKSFDQCFFCFAKCDCITGVNDLAFRARTGNVMDLCCLGEGLPPVNPMLFG